MNVREVLSIWTMYDSPADKPGYFVLRRHVLLNDSTHGPTTEAYCSQDIEPLREMMMQRGLTCMARQPGDEPQIVEIWL